MKNLVETKYDDKFLLLCNFRDGMHYLSKWSYFCWFFRNLTFLMILKCTTCQSTIRICSSKEWFNLVCELLEYVPDQLFQDFSLLSSFAFIMLNLVNINCDSSTFKTSRVYLLSFLDTLIVVVIALKGWNSLLFEWCISLFRRILFLSSVKHFHCSINCWYVTITAKPCCIKLT